MSKPGMVVYVTKTPEKVLMFTTCCICGISGMAYQDPQSKIVKKHYCSEHNPLIYKTKPQEPLTIKTCKEQTCLKDFTNNARNSHNTKEFCSSYCSSKYSNRQARLERRNREFKER